MLMMCPAKASVRNASRRRELDNTDVDGQWLTSADYAELPMKDCTRVARKTVSKNTKE